MSSPTPLPFTGPWLLAPMEGVTDPAFRGLVLEHNPPEHLGGAFTEFVRVVRDALPHRILRAHLGTRVHRAPVGLQLMGSDREALAESARRALEVGAPLVDLNFGCPAKGAIKTCAGSALLRDPREVERTIASVVRAVPTGLVTAKIRAGYDDAEQVEELAQAAENGGAAMLTIHCRTRKEHYQPEVDWTRIERAVRAVSIPVCGNGGVESTADLERMRQETGCAYVMVGRAALADPWIFCGHTASRAEAARFLNSYAARMLASPQCSARGAAGRVKQLLRTWRQGGLFESDRRDWLGEKNHEQFLERLRALEASTPEPAHERTHEQGPERTSDTKEIASAGRRPLARGARAMTMPGLPVTHSPDHP